jgi:hypothetical protein
MMVRRAALLSLGAGVFLGLYTGSSGAAASRSSSHLTLYSVAGREQFVNNEDDRARGKGNNPFGNYKDVTAAQKEAGNGPFAGDEAIYGFQIYDNPTLKQAVGTATLVCQYDLDKNAFCDAVYRLPGGTLIGAGEFNFNASHFELAITSGTGKYRNASGQLLASPGDGHSQRLALTLG